jgi:hypothetical protein
MQAQRAKPGKPHGKQPGETPLMPGRMMTISRVLIDPNNWYLLAHLAGVITE